MKTLRFFSLFGVLLCLVACGGADPVQDPSGGNPPPSDSAPDEAPNDPSVRGTRLHPLRVETSAQMRAFSFYDVSGFRVCEVGVSPQDKIKQSIFVNLAGPAEACPSDPKRALTLVLRKFDIDTLGLQLSAGMSVETGVIVPQRDIGNDRMVAFVTDFIKNGRFSFRP